FFVVGATGYNEVQQSWNGTLVDGPAWSPTSNTQVFAGYDSTSGHNQLFTATINGGPATMLTNGAQDFFGPCWSPNGSKICVHANLDGNLYTMNANGTAIAALTSVNGGQTVASPAWSPE